MSEAPDIGAPARLPAHIMALLATPFVNRTQHLQKIHQSLWGPDRRAVAMVPASLRAMHGIGKSAIVAEYVRRLFERYGQVAWVDAGDIATLPAQLVASAAASGATVGRRGSLRDCAQRALTHMARPYDNKPWLVVFDDVADIDALAAFLPGGYAHCLMTSNHVFWPDAVETCKVDVLGSDDAAQLLMTISGEAEIDAAHALALQLGYLPLALRQAGAYARQTGITLSDYQVIVQAAHEHQQSAGNTSAASATTALLLQHLRAQPGDGFALLQNLAFMRANDIQADWFRSAAGEGNGGNAPAPDPLARAIELLVQYELIGVGSDDSDAAILCVNTIVQEAVRQRLAQEKLVPHGRAGLITTLIGQLEDPMNARSPIAHLAALRASFQSETDTAADQDVWDVVERHLDAPAPRYGDSALAASPDTNRLGWAIGALGAITIAAICGALAVFWPATIAPVVDAFSALWR